MMYSAIKVIGTLYGRGIYNDTQSGAGDFPGAALFFLHTHIRANAQGAGRRPVGRPPRSGAQGAEIRKG